ncbi:MAG: alpha/beta fold hydrolase [Bacteroidota bacterium]
MVPANETFGGTFPFQPNFNSASGFQMHYVDEGKGDVILCLHGEPTWGYLYRNFIPVLSKNHRVIVPDHMGFGKSETPKDREYTFKSHVENLIAFMDDLGLKDITVVAQDWGGPIIGSVALRRPELIRRFCLMNTMLGYSGALKDAPDTGIKDITPIHKSPWFTWITSNLENGVYHQVMENIHENILSVMKKLYFHNSAAVDQHWMDAYSAPFKNPEDRIAAIEFPLDVALNRIGPFVVEGIKMGNIEQVRSKPAMLAEGMLDKAMPPALVMDDFKKLFPKGPIVEIPNAGHFCQEDTPQVLTSLILQFIQLTD